MAIPVLALCSGEHGFWIRASACTIPRRVIMTGWDRYAHATTLRYRYHREALALNTYHLETEPLSNLLPNCQ